MFSFKRISLLFALCSLAFLTYTCSSTTTGPSETDDPDNGNNSDTSEQFESQAAPGSSAEAFLKDEQYTTLQVEIDYMPGHKPTREGRDSLKSFLENRLNKQSISLRTPTEIESGGQSSYTAADIRSIEKENRDHFTTGDGNTLEVYFLVVDGEYNDGEGGGSNVLGVAYWNSSVAFFGEKIEEVSSGIGAPSEEKIEGTVFRHEFGHNMGLVGNGTPTQSNHKTSGSAHCTEDGCLMNPAVETGDFFSNLFDGNIPGLDPLCIEDLQANGGK